MRTSRWIYSGAVTPHQLDEVDWRVTLVDTGLKTMTGGRVKRMQPFIGNETFLLTYGDGVANVDRNACFSSSTRQVETMTAVRPNAIRRIRTKWYGSHKL